MQQRAKSSTLEKIFESYENRLQQRNRTDNYGKGFRWLKGYLHFVTGKRVSDLAVGDAEIALAHRPTGNRNFDLRLLAQSNVATRSSSSTNLSRYPASTG